MDATNDAARVPQADEETVRVYQMEAGDCPPLIVESLDVLLEYVRVEMQFREVGEQVTLSVKSMSRAAVDALPEWEP